MTGIVSYGAYIPYYRMKKSTIAQVYGKRAGKGARAVAYYDEDSVTMSVTAAMDALQGCDPAALTALYFASTSSPYREKQAATEVMAALDVDQALCTADIANTLRAGSTAMLMAAEAAEKRGGPALVTMSDCRPGAADGKFESDLGDGAAAFVMGCDDLLATLDDSYSFSREALDLWRSDSDAFVREWDVRYANTQIYTPAVIKAVKALLAQMGLQPADFSKLVLYGHDDKTRLGAAAKLGFQPEQVAASMYAEIGNTGSAAAGLMLCSVLDDAKPGDRILMVTYGEGCDAMAFTVTEKAAACRAATRVDALLAHKNDELPYGKYLKWKGLVATEPQKRPARERSAQPDFLRNHKKNHHLYGSRCTECGTAVFPPQRVCVHCHSIDKREPYCFLNKKAHVRTFTIDGVSLSLDSPNILTVLEFEGGGKMMTFLVDCQKEDVRVGMAVRPAYRKMFKADGIHTYFWKVVPAQEVEA